jgi:PIN domain nuclease of toxin-antitoxin system
MRIAQALSEGFTFVSGDPTAEEYGVKVIW